MVKINYNIFALLPRHQDNLANSSLVGQCYFRSLGQGHLTIAWFDGEDKRCQFLRGGQYGFESPVVRGLGNWLGAHRGLVWPVWRAWDWQDLGAIGRTKFPGMGG